MINIIFIYFIPCFLRAVDVLSSYSLFKNCMSDSQRYLKRFFRDCFSINDMSVSSKTLEEIINKIIFKFKNRLYLSHFFRYGLVDRVLL